MGFSKLPAECLERIAQYLGPHDVLSFALTGRFNHASSGRCLQRRSELHRRFGSLCIGLCDSGSLTFPSYFEHSDEVLYQIWKDPAVADYIEYIHFDPKDFNGGFEDDEGVGHVVAMVQEANQFRDLRRAHHAGSEPSSALPPSSEAIRPADELQNRHEHSTALLLAQLPNLKRFDVAITSLGAYGLKDLLLWDNDDRYGLGRVEEVGYVCTHDRSEAPRLFPVDDLTGLRRLTKLRIFTHKWIQIGPGLPPITQLEITGGDLLDVLQTLPACLEQLACLKSFRYHMHCGCSASQDPLDPDDGSAFFKGLQSAVGDRLEELSLSGFYWPAPGDRFPPCTRMQTRTFTGFPKLKFLEIEVQSLLDYEVWGDDEEDFDDEALEEGFYTDASTEAAAGASMAEDDEIAGAEDDGSDSAEDEDDDGSEAGEKACSTRLLDVLPPSIEKLRLGLARRPQDELHPEGLFKDLGGQAAARLPNFKTFAYCHNYWRDGEGQEYMATIKAELKEAGIRIVRIRKALHGQLVPEHYWAPRQSDMCRRDVNDI